MSLSRELKNTSVVVVARNFNPSIFTQQWLIDKKVIDGADSEMQQIFTPQFVHTSNNNFRLTVLPEQLIFEVVNSPKDTFVNMVNSKLVPIIQALNETPFTAVGVNMQWHIFDTEQNVGELSEKWFDKKEGVFSLFDTPDARFGAYMSRNFLNVRLKLDIKPVTERDNDTLATREFVMPAFNFHRDILSAEKYTELLEVINNCELFLNESVKTVNSL